MLSDLAACVAPPVDSDLMIRRGLDERGARAPFLARAQSLFRRDDAALTLALPITPPLPPAPATVPFSDADASGRPWRVEVRGCFIQLPRLLAARPFVSDSRSGSGPASLRPWHRALDSTISASGGRLRSIRGGDAAAVSFVHPANELKADSSSYGLLIDYVERGGPLPASLAGHVDAPSGGFSACSRAALASAAAAASGSASTINMRSA